MSRVISRGTCSTRPGNAFLSLELYPLYHAFLSDSNLDGIMMQVAHAHPTMARFDKQMMRTLAEEVYGMSTDAQAAEGLVRGDTALLAEHLNKLNTLYLWPFLQRIAADWAPMVRAAFFNRVGEQLQERPLYCGMQDDDLVRGSATNQQRCRTTEIPLAGWPLTGVSSAPPTFARPVPLRPEPHLGPRGMAPGSTWKPDRAIPGPVATQLCSTAYRR